MDNKVRKSESNSALSPVPAVRAPPRPVQPEKRISPQSPPATPSPLAKSPRPSFPAKTPSPPQSSPRPSVVPLEYLDETARLVRGPAREGSTCLTDDALMAGWLCTPGSKQGEFVIRFFQLRSGSLVSYEALNSRVMPRTPNTVLKLLPVPESVTRWLRPDVNTMVQIVDPAIFKLGTPSLLLTASQAKMMQESFTHTSPEHVRILICFRTDVSGGAPVQVAVRLSALSVHVFDLGNALEYTLMGLVLQATEEPVSTEFPYGLRVSSSASDDMFVPLKNLLLVARSPMTILQWMASLQSADLDPPPPQPTPSRQGLHHGTKAVTRGDRSGSGALIGQLVSNAVGHTGSFSNLSELVGEKSNDAQKKELSAMLRALKWDAANPPELRKVIFEHDYQLALSEFCKTIFTEENVNFCIAVGDFKSARDIRAKQALSRQIAAEFISYSGKSVVNISSAARKRIDDILQSGVPLPAHLFDVALEEVLTLIEQDSWPKFCSKLNEMADEAAMDRDDNSYDSGDSSSYEERKSSRREANDFGEAAEISRPEDLERIRAEIAKNPAYDPKDPPTLKVLLAKRDLRRLLQDFAKTLLAEENVMFWEHVQRFKANDSVDERKKYLKMLFDEFIPAGSKTMVNIAGTERSRLMKLYGEQGTELALTKDVFDAALVECIKVMELDLYPKFLHLMKDVKSVGAKETTRSKVPPLWEILNDPEELNQLLLFATSNNQQDDILFWCLVQRFRVEADPEARFKMGTYVMSSYVAANAPRMIRVDKAKKAACVERFSELVSRKANLPADLFDALWRDAQTSMNKHLHPAYEKFVRKPKKGAAVLAAKTSTNMLQHEIDEALKDDDDEKHQPSKWVAIKSADTATSEKKTILGGGRRKPTPSPK